MTLLIVQLSIGNPLSSNEQTVFENTIKANILVTNSKKRPFIIETFLLSIIISTRQILVHTFPIT